MGAATQIQAASGADRIGCCKAKMGLVEVQARPVRLSIPAFRGASIVKVRVEMTLAVVRPPVVRDQTVKARLLLVSAHLTKAARANDRRIKTGLAKLVGAKVVYRRLGVLVAVHE